MNIIKKSDKMTLVHSDIRGTIFQEALKMEREGEKVLKLNTGNPGKFGFEMPESIKSALLENLENAVPYCDLRGTKEARRAIKEYHEAQGVPFVDEDNIFVGNGVSEVVSMATTAYLNFGDEILVPCPCYSLWANCAYIAGAKPVYYVCDEKANWYPDIEDIKKKITSKTKAILIINPNNPTGAVYPVEILEEIANIAREHNLVIFSDEIYDRLIMDGKVHTPMAKVAPDVIVVTMNGLSKSHVICGMRCGWMIITGPTENASEFIEGIVALASMRLCSNALAQFVIPAALKDSESTKAMMVPGGRLFEQREAACRAMDKSDDLSYVKNSAAFYMFPKIDVKKHNITSDKQFAMDLLKAKKILIVAGSGFDYPTPDHFRIVMLPEPDELYNALIEIGDFLDGYKQK
ncbi:MAG: aminotransferase class I/II-fold pyridoxal phosphate-dependent enzyme [Ruminococcaceae bacterium]|nr:aminotransferase class I/II-fold pyridoxal phosphate-dependent enzyme [Oscillospiraceae bacterium]